MSEQQKEEVGLQSVRVNGWLIQSHWVVGLILLVFALLPAAAVPAYVSGGQYIANNTLGYVSTATNLGVSIWLQPHNRSSLDALAQDLYDPISSNYRHWLKSFEIAARFAPALAEAKMVQDFFEVNHLKVVSIGPNNFYIRAQGTVANVESAFHVQLNNYQIGSQTLRSNASDPYIEGPAAALVQAVSGLDNGSIHHSLMLQPISPLSISGSSPIKGIPPMRLLQPIPAPSRRFAFPVRKRNTTRP
jgi:subtilase family serine protease